MELYPFKFYPIYKEKVWGGTNLKKVLKRNIQYTCAVGESWDLCAHNEGTSIISNGCFEGKKITEVIHSYSEEILGESYKQYKDKFPLLFKFIDANDKLSVQVHPDDNYAMANEGELGKTEMWFVIDAKPRAKIVYGLKEGTTKEAFQLAVEHRNIENTLTEIEVKPGDVFFIPSGTIHAIGEGIVIAEIQQNSDTTYRVFDWNRVGLDGMPRQLHIEKSLDTINFAQDVNKASLKGISKVGQGYLSTHYVCCPYFTVEVLDIIDRYKVIQKPKMFEVLMCIEGSFNMLYNNREESLMLGELILIPAGMKDYRIEGKGKIIKTYILDPREVCEGLEASGLSKAEIDSILYT